MRRIASFLTLLLGIAAFAVAASPSAQAHERRQVGNYILVVGFENEPAYVEEMNAALITVFRADGTPVEGVDKTLQVEIGTGGQTRTLALHPEVNRAGTYTADFIPTKTGAYTFRFFGKIENLDLNERFESGPNRFDEVVSKSELQFPAPVPSNAELAATIGGSQSSAGQSGGTAGPAAADVQRALDRADSARTTGLVVGGIGILLGLAGVVLGLTARRSRGNRGSRPAVRQSRPEEPV